MSADRERLYFVNPVVDFALIGGVSIVAWVVFARLLPGHNAAASLVAAQLSWVVNWPHFAATNQRLYGSREHLRQYPMTALLVPWLVVAGIVGSLAAPTVVAPSFVKLFLLWSPYHFSGQTVGITLVYARRAGFPVDRPLRLSLAAFVFGTFIVQTIAAETSLAGQQYWGIRYAGMGLPPWMLTIARIQMWSGAVAFLACLALAARRARRAPPVILLLPAVAQFLWFVAGAGQGAFQEFVPGFHSLQYLLIAWSMQLKEALDRGHRPPSPLFVVRESLRWGIVAFAGGAVLFWGLPRLVAAGGVQLGLATGVVIAGVQIHHFFVDGVIWKLKRAHVVSPLLMTLRDVVRGPTAAPGVAATKVA